MKEYLRPDPYLIASQRFFSVLINQRALLFEMTKRDVFEPHAGQFFGWVWPIVHPLALMAVYIFVFGIVFAARMGGARELPYDYTTYILSGLIAWLTLQQALTKSCDAIVGESNLVKQVVFPLEILPTKAIVSTMGPQLVSIGILIIYVIIKHGYLPLTFFLLPFIVLVQMLGSIGLALIISAVTVFVRDVRELVQLFSLVGLFILPVIYLPQWVPDAFKPVIYMNPISHMIWCYQDVLFYGRFEHPWSWPIFILGSLLLFAVGARFFRSVKHMFGDAL